MATVVTLAQLRCMARQIDAGESRCAKLAEEGHVDDVPSRFGAVLGKGSFGRANF